MQRAKRRALFGFQFSSPSTLFLQRRKKAIGTIHHFDKISLFAQDETLRLRQRKILLRLQGRPAERTLYAS